MAKCLSRLKISYEMLKSAFEDNVDDSQAFHDFLHGAGITRKAWCEKSGTIFEDENQRSSLCIVLTQTAFLKPPLK